MTDKEKRPRQTLADVLRAYMQTDEAAPKTRQQLQRELRASRAGVRKALQQLEEAGCVRLRGKVRADNGLLANEYEVVP